MKNLEKDELELDEIEDIETEEEVEETEIDDEEDLDEESEKIDFNSVKDEDVDLDNATVLTSNTSDPIRLYLKEIGSIPLLTSEQEYEMSMNILEGRTAEKRLKEIEASEDRKSNTSIEEYNELKRIVDKAKYSRDKLSTANLRLVVAIAKKYIGKGLPFEDLIQEGNMGLLKAIEKFDCTKGFKFSTYATWWIKQSVTRAVADQARTIRIPVHMVETINCVKKIERELTAELSRAPSDQEIVDRYNSTRSDKNLTIDKLNQIRQISVTPISLEQKVGEEEDSCLGDFIADDSSDTPFEYTKKLHLKQEIDKVFNELLTERERQVIELRFGLNGGNPMTLEDVAKSFVPHVTRERIRQIEAKAIRKISRSPKARCLKDFLRK